MPRQREVQDGGAEVDAEAAVPAEYTQGQPAGHFSS